MFGPLPLARAQSTPSTEAYVYRDEHGVPHITAETEENAWYALGYEQARDALLFIQYACKAAKGELTWVRGDAAGINNDMAVKILGVHLGGLSLSELRTLFAPVNTSINANFYDNCVAFAAGANAYREKVKTISSTSLPAEVALRAWLDAHRFPPVLGVPMPNTLAWVYDDVIAPEDIASQGALTTSFWSFFRAELSLVNSNGIGYTDDDSDTGGSGGPVGPVPVDPEMVGDPLDPSSAVHLLEQMRKYASGASGMASAMSGSNSFGWSGLFCKDPATSMTYAGLLADPHQAVGGFSPDFMRNFSNVPNHLWFAHVRVTPPGQSLPTLDVFGHVPHASATFQSSHNRTLASGGTAGAPNFKDHFVLRLEEDPQGAGAPQSPHKFYSYYHDTASTNTTYQPITQHQIQIKAPNGVIVPVPYWRAESFGFILPRLSDVFVYALGYAYGTNPTPPTMPVIYGERTDPAALLPKRWRVDTRTVPAPPKMRYWASPQFDVNGLITSPMVVSLRVPMDAAVAGNPLGNPLAPLAREERHWQLARDFWLIAHGTSVLDVMDRTNGAGFAVNVCFADNAGRTLSTQLSAIPKRGVDSALASAGYSSLDKFVFYSLAAGPVPARHHADKMFDWQFSGFANPARPAPLEYLDYPRNTPMTNITGPFKAIALQDPTPGTTGAFPPYRVSGAGSSFKIEGGQYTSACNDMVWGNSRRRDAIEWNSSPTGQYGYNNLTTDDNWLLTKVLDWGVAYQTQAIAFEAPVNQQIVVDRMSRMAEFATSGIQGLPPMTPSEMREFVVSPKMFSAPDYVPPANVTTDPILPAPIRQLKEVVANPAHPGSPLVRAEKEIKFFRDFWQELFNPASLWNNHQVQPGVTVNLRDLWVQGYGNVAGHPDQVFWYSNPANTATAKWIDMPDVFPLIDFLWTESELSRGFTVGSTISGSAITVLSLEDQVWLDWFVNNVLVPWQYGLPAADRYRNEPSSPGACLLEMMRMGYNGQDVFGRKWVRLRRGSVESSAGHFPLTQTGQLPAGLGTLNQTSVAWATLRDLAFPLYQYTTLFAGDLEPPYDALYDQTGQVRATLGAAETNALVEFFLKLGGHYIAPAHNEDNPSRKMARWELANQDSAAFMGFLPGNYPLTAGLERLTAVRALLDAGAFMQNSIPQFRQHFQARAYDHYGQPLWPLPLNVDYVGHGLRSVAWHEDESATGWSRDHGYQPKFLGMGGSYATLLAMFPSQGEVESYFWCTPGVEVMGADPSRFKKHMDAHAANTLMRSHFTDFATNPVSVVTHTYPPTH